MMTEQICKNCKFFSAGIHGWGECEKYSTKFYKKLAKKVLKKSDLVGVEVGTHETNWCRKWEATDD